METNKDTIENLFESAFDSRFEVQGSTSWRQMRIMRMKAVFLKFRVNTLNIYYVSAFTILIVALFLMITQTPISDSNIQTLVLSDSSQVTINKKTIEFTTTKEPIIKNSVTPKQISKETKEEIKPNVDETSHTIIPITETPTLPETEITNKESIIPSTPKKIKKVVVIESQEQVVVKDTVIKVVTKKVRAKK